MARRTLALDDRSARWDKRLEWPLLIVSVGFLVAYAVPIVAPTVPAGVARACDIVVLVSWVLFAADYAFRWSIAREKARLCGRTCWIWRSWPCRCCVRCGSSGWRSCCRC